MGLFSKIKKAFKKVVKGVKKVVKKVVKGVKKVVKKIGSSKILKALAIAAAVVVTGGAALTAFGGTGALATSKLGAFMMNASGKMLGGTVFGGTGTLAKIGNVAIKTVSKPFGAIGGALGSTARVGANLLTGQPAFQAGPGQVSAYGNPLVSQGGEIVAGTGQAASAPFSGAAVGGVTAPVTEVAGEAATEKYFFGNKWGDLAVRTGAGVVGGVVSGAAQAKLMEGDPSGQMAGLANESKEYQDKLQVFAENNNINLDDIYGQLTYGTADPAYQINSDLYRQDTVGVPA
jgi:hypothetical protein|tara:strand:+ start:1496 stop:2362 length:867 start_codon:yes stop_codon:yes gene_type:complete